MEEANALVRTLRVAATKSDTFRVLYCHGWYEESDHCGIVYQLPSGAENSQCESLGNILLNADHQALLARDLENRIKEGSITALFNTTVREIRPESLLLHTPDGPREIANQWVLAMTGYHPDFDLLQRFGVTFAEDGWRTPIYDETTFETRRPGVYVAGTVCGGTQTGRWFIENGRFHAKQIAEHMAGASVERIPYEQIHWKTQE